MFAAVICVNVQLIAYPGDPIQCSVGERHKKSPLPSPFPPLPLPLPPNLERSPRNVTIVYVLQSCEIIHGFNALQDLYPYPETR